MLITRAPFNEELAHVPEEAMRSDFLLKRLQETRPRSLKLAALFDKPSERRVDLKPDYFFLQKDDDS